MYKLWATIVKDFRVMLRDKMGLAIMLVMPIVLVVVVTSIQSGMFELVNKNRLQVLVSNQDTGKSSRLLIRGIRGIGMFQVTETSKNEKNMADAMRHADAMLGIIIPPDFSQRVGEKSQNASDKAMKSFGLGDSIKKAAVIHPATPLMMYYNPILQESIRLSVKGALQSAQQMVESRETLRKIYFAINEKPLSDTLENEMLNHPITINDKPASRNGQSVTPNVTQHNVPAWTIFAMFFVVMSLGAAVVREKRSGSYIRLKTLPTSYHMALISKQVVYLGVTILQAAIIFSIGSWLFPFFGLRALNPPSDIFALVVTTLICGWCAVSYSICVGVYADTQQQSNGFGAVSVVILACIGGLMVPSFAMVGAYKTAANLSPMHWCLQAYYTLFLEGGKLKDILNNLLPLFIITLVIQLITYIGLKRKNLI